MNTLAGIAVLAGVASVSFLIELTKCKREIKKASMRILAVALLVTVCLPIPGTEHLLCDGVVTPRSQIIEV